MSIENARAHLAKYGKDKDIIEFSTSSATVKEAAADLNTEEGRIAKTMSFMLSDGPIVILAAGDGKIDNRKFKDRFHEKAKMISPDDVENMIGHTPPIGCPIMFSTSKGTHHRLDAL